MSERGAPSLLQLAVELKDPFQLTSVACRSRRIYRSPGALKFSHSHAQGLSIDIPPYNRIVPPAEYVLGSADLIHAMVHNFEALEVRNPSN